TGGPVMPPRRLSAAPLATAALLAACAPVFPPPAADAADAPGLLTSRPLPPRPKGEPLPVPGEIRTGADQRYRALLPDGSVLFVNRSTTVELTEKDLITL